MKTINLKKNQLVANGAHGLYFKISARTGVKILKKQGTKKIPNLKTVKSQKVIQEATIGVLAKSPTKNLALVKYQNLYYIGIVQTHIVSIKKGKQEFNESVVQKIKKSLAKNQVIHSDIFPNNVFETRKGFVLIDFDPDHSHFVGDKIKYYQVKNRLVKDLKKDF